MLSASEGRYLTNILCDLLPDVPGAGPVDVDPGEVPEHELPLIVDIDRAAAAPPLRPDEPAEVVRQPLPRPRRAPGLGLRHFRGRGGCGRGGGGGGRLDGSPGHQGAAGRACGDCGGGCPLLGLGLSPEPGARPTGRGVLPGEVRLPRPRHQPLQLARPRPPGDGGGDGEGLGGGQLAPAQHHALLPRHGAGALGSK